jgi:flotillin
VNITDITDESGYIDSIGKKAAAEAINQAKVDVAEQEKRGSIGESEATRERVIRVAENVAESDKGQKKAEADKRIFIKHREAAAVGGENQALAEIARTNAELAVQQAESARRGEVARLEAEVEIQKAQYKAESERLNALEVVRQEVDKRKTEIAAEAEAEKTRREARGVADAILLKYQAEAEGIRKVLESKAAGYLDLVRSCNGDAKAAATLLMTEKIEQIVQLQVEAIRNIKIDKITVWDSAGAGADGTATANFLAGMIKCLPPLHDVAGLAGIELPKYLGHVMAETDRRIEP